MGDMMTDDIMTLREKCKHGFYDAHGWCTCTGPRLDLNIPKGRFEPYENFEHGPVEWVECDHDNCLGGRERQARPMVRQGGISGAWYPARGEEPEGWLVISASMTLTNPPALTNWRTDEQDQL